MIAIILIGWTTWAALAQNTVNPSIEAGAIQRQVDSALPALQTGKARNGQAIAMPSVPQAILDDSDPAPDEPTIFVRAWKFSGNTVHKSDVLRRVLAPVTGRNLSIKQLNSAARAIEAHYAVSGYVAQATLPPQEVANGIVNIQILDAAYGGVVFEGEAPSRVHPDVIRKVFDSHISKGDLLRPAKFDLPNLLVNDLPGVTVTGAFAPGRTPGETVLLLNTADAPFGFGQVALDNFGSRATGSTRAVGQFALNSPFGYGDLARADVAKTDGSQSISGGYSVPLGPKGTRLSANVSTLRYDVITPEMRDLNVSGQSLSRSVSLVHPFRRSRGLNMNLNLTQSVVDLENSVRGDVVSDYSVTSSTIGMNGNWRDPTGSGAVVNFGVTFAQGITKGSNASGAFKDRFNVFRINGDRTQYVAKNTALFLGFSGQHAARGLNSSEEFSLGGPNGVRAYPAGEAGGPRGAVVKLELRLQLTPQWGLMGFFDYGIVSGRDATNEPSSYNLKGLGATVSWNGPHGWGADLTWAHRLGTNPNPIVDANQGEIGNDQDGSLDQNRFWFVLRKTF